MKPSGVPPGNGFTLIELIVAMTIVLVMAVVFGAMISQMNLAWVGGQQRMQNFQNGRAILEIMSRELAPAAISYPLQFIEDPAVSGKSNISTLIPPITGSTIAQTPGTDSLFWARPGTATSLGNIYETGYFLITVTTAGVPIKYQLARFNMPPDNVVTDDKTTKNAHATSTINTKGSFYWINDPPTAWASTAYTVSTPWPEWSDAPWLTTLSSLNPYTGAIAPTTYAIVSDGVIAMWIQCLDRNGNPIPWLSQSSLYTLPTSSAIKFNSAASFTPPMLGNASSSFTYTAPATAISASGTAPTATTFVGPSSSGTIAANRLPSSVQLTLITLDSETLTRLGSKALPSIPTTTGPFDVANEVQVYLNSLAASPYNIKSAKVFSTTVRLVNGTD